MRTSFWAVPAFILVDPATTSGPASTTMAISDRPSMGVPRLQTMEIERAPTSPAFPSAPRTKGVLPEAERATNASDPEKPWSSRAFPPIVSSSSAASTERKTASGPPAINAWNPSGRTPKVGGSSAASITPRRPLVPAPTKKTLPPFRIAPARASTAAAMLWSCPAIASATFLSSSLMILRISSTGFPSMPMDAGFLSSVDPFMGTPPRAPRRRPRLSAGAPRPPRHPAPGARGGPRPPEGGSAAR